MTVVILRWLCASVIAVICFLSGDLLAEPNCEAQSRITHDFDNGAQWDFCWESRIRENLVLSDIHYTAPGQEAFKVMGSARLSQLHVAYDDSDVTYNDVTQFGLGGNFLITLTDADCPDGELLNIQNRPALCLWQTQSDSGSATPTRTSIAQSINLFSVSQVGAYAYISSWIFYDNGSFEPGVGATGALQRSSASTELPFGRVLQGDLNTLWLSHTHNYYWRLDFDLGESATDDRASELRYIVDEQGQRALTTEIFNTEQARQTDPATQQIWRILENDDSAAAGFQIEPLRNGHRFERKAIEPETEYDFFVTVGNDCERFASQNARFNPDCLNHVLQYVDGQSLVGEDIVIWNRVAFHHVPRNEDQRHMHTHWDGFLIKPFNIHKASSTLPDTPNTAPQFQAIEDMQTTVAELVHSDALRATDADGDLLSHMAEDLPDGLEMRLDGHVHGYPSTVGTYDVEVTAWDDSSETQLTFSWTVTDNSIEIPANDEAVPVITGANGFAMLAILAFFQILRRNPFGTIRWRLTGNARC